MEILAMLSCAATVLFGFIQLYQWRILFKNKKEIDEIWSQIKTLASTTAKELSKIKIEQENAEKSR
jgi:hypothetical protein